MNGRRPHGAAMALLATTVAAQPLAAQTAPTGSDRAGPEARPPALPAFPTGRELSPSPVPAAPNAGAVPALLVESISVREVIVATDGDAAAALPPAAWRPPSDVASGFRLNHDRGQPLDANWVRSQFAANLGSDGGTAAQAVALVQLINRAYLTAGFFNSGLLVGEQPDLAAGTLRLELVFGRLSAGAGIDAVNVRWTSNRAAGLTEDYVRNRFPSARGRPLSAFQIERDFRLLAEDPAIATINAQLLPGSRPGEAMLNLVVDPARRFDTYIGVSNDRSPSVGGERFFVGGFARNLVTGGDLMTAEFGTASGLDDAQASYSFPLISPALSATLRGTFNNAAVIDRPLLPLDISARDRSLQAGLSWRIFGVPLMPTTVPDRWSPSQNLSVGAIVVNRWQRSFLFGQPFSFAPGSVDGRAEYRVLRLVADYLMRDVDQVLAISLTGTLGLGGTQSRNPAIPNPDDNFRALLLQANYARRIGGSGLELRARLSGQVADGVLYSGERVSIGGETSVRGYRQNLFLADNAAIGSVELALPFSLSPRARRSGGVDWAAFTASLFADAALFDTLQTPSSEHSLASVGVGLAWAPSEAITVRVSYGVALNEIELPGSRDLQDRGVQFRVVVYPLRFF